MYYLSISCNTSFIYLNYLFKLLTLKLHETLNVVISTIGIDFTRLNFLNKENPIT